MTKSNIKHYPINQYRSDYNRDDYLKNTIAVLKRCLWTFPEQVEAFIEYPILQNRHTYGLIYTEDSRGRLYQHLTFCNISIEAMCQNKSKRRQKEASMTGRFFCHIKKSFGGAFKGEKGIRRLARNGSKYKYNQVKVD